ncbi:N-acetylglucosamine-specific PTS transporter subunit IIBC [Larsenimonas salina]|uniref:N-acetylglucosamine-specific PTS transporter subunit IIBC n=1 Tax=Larsenimonas salina TaxID=1295565 RepID=UPI002073F5AA|nr:N-acetylglucosamine-specific PTS transporter subunit IIBC [Larsenimonas salina]MCM5705503.1 N-acetylglucosamine-specific PTS transporter subunit IIBC [Larsenimonas salina]
MRTPLGQTMLGGLQLLGRSLMLPIAVLPVAGLLLRLGQPDLLDVAFIADAGNAIFAQLALIFAIGVAVGIADDNNGAAGLAGTIGYLVLTAVLKALDPEINMGVLAGIVMGVVAGVLYNRYRAIDLPDYLAFFGGRRFIPIATGLSAVVLGVAFGYLWPPIQHGIDLLGQWLIDAGELGLFVYGVLNRILIVTGLHHVLNSFVWFVFGHYGDATGDLNRFFAGDPSAGSFMAGFFPVMMFGLPGAALAMYHCARRDRRAQVGGLLLSLALTAFLTGVTEPLEFTFMFLAPVLYGIHALLTGASMALMSALGVKLGFTFSAGAFDYGLSYGLSTNGWMLLPVGVVFFALYYGIFRWAIARFDIATPGREKDTVTVTAEELGERGPAFVTALGGAHNINGVGACTTRLRLILASTDSIDESALRSLGARAVLKLSGGGLQVIVGPIADQVADDIRQAMRAQGTAPSETVATAEDTSTEPAQALDSTRLREWLEALGGRDNLHAAAPVAHTRVRLTLADADRLDLDALHALGVQGHLTVAQGVVHLIVGDEATALGQALDAARTA